MKISKMCAIAALAVAGASTAATAQTVSFEWGDFNPGNPDNPGTFNGGEFIATFSDGGGSFRTFCLEKDEFISPVGSPEYDYTLVGGEIGAEEGGLGGPNPDPLSAATAMIFVNWLNGNITNNAANNVAVQRAIWYLEEELPGTTFADLDADTQGILNSWTGGEDINPGADDFVQANFPNIRVLNPTRTVGGEIEYYQSMIILIPLPAASGMALAGLALVGGIRRRK